MSRARIDDLRTPAARALVRRLVSTAEEMARKAEDEAAPSYLQARFAAKAETYRLVLEWIIDELVDAERQVIDIEISESARLDALLDTFEGVPA